ncbi:MAG: VanZ family protein, partial [Microthrixaceae bacterium]
MRPETLNAAIAIAGGLLLAVLGFVPAAALHYRRSGRFSGRDLLALVVLPVYGLALWTYTLLPLPDPADVVCRTALTEPLHFVDDLRGVWDGSVLGLLRDPVFLQIVLNVALFVPMGVLLRLRYGRGLLWAFGAGLSMSLLIETTQLTGIWGLYDCAYRFFDVDDLLFNTTGALLGSLLALPFARRFGEQDGGDTQIVATTGRRIVAIVSDLLIMVFVGAAAVVVWRVFVVELGDTAPSQVDTTRQALVQWGTPFALQAAAVLGGGATIGEAVTRMRTVPRSRAWTLPSRLVKLVTGVGAVAAFGVWSSPWSSVGLLGLGVAMVVAAVVTRDHRGL